jgi:DNA-binding HxlR family transcriptional regulator
MRSYEEYCALAQGLDVIGDRWTLLIVRELLIRGDCRYSDLQYGLPGIATNLLADRLRQLEESGIVTRETLPPPAGAAVFRLTPLGESLESVIEAIGRWGYPLLADAPTADYEFRTHWLVLPLRIFLKAAPPEGPPVTVEIDTGNEPLTIKIADRTVDVRPGAATNPDATLTAPPKVVVDLFMGDIDLNAAKRKGAHVDGDVAAIRQVLPKQSRTAARST